MAEEFVNGRVGGDKVVVFTKPTCSYCILASDVLSKYRFKTGHLDLVDISARQDMGRILDWLNRKTGARTVSDLTAMKDRVGEECVGGGTDVAELDKSGRLEEMLQSIGALQ
ncbi:hypothetical protein SKAU_G00015180 [Synaphobranchus kaupii]|uniref:Glutaredoxin domain-containing protein n=1 Tax=Synaphobranchus kaupii TaxID=118154 RepID=A0A9Q1GBX1_SYNKA|nr:hypothetical protein SKAU_G00015180 [Synaphobranchus kaupii]